MTETKTVVALGDNQREIHITLRSHDQNDSSFEVGPPGFEPGISAVLIDRQM